VSARAFNGLRGLARAPWDAPDTSAADALADRAAAARAVLAGAEDADPRHVAAALGLGAVSLRMHRAAVQRMPWESAWTAADAAVSL